MAFASRNRRHYSIGHHDVELGFRTCAGGSFLHRFLEGARHNGEGLRFVISRELTWDWSNYRRGKSAVPECSASRVCKRKGTRLALAYGEPSDRSSRSTSRREADTRAIPQTDPAARGVSPAFYAQTRAVGDQMKSNRRPG
jgi:hypothetical protein